MDNNHRRLKSKMELIDRDELLIEVMGITDGWLRPPKNWKSYEDSIRNAPRASCANCKWYSGSGEVCVNNESDWCGDFRVPSKLCECWEYF
jgi:hypothetical protein